MESEKRENVTEAKDRFQVQTHHCVEIIQSTLKFEILTKKTVLGIDCRIDWLILGGGGLFSSSLKPELVPLQRRLLDTF